MKGFISFTLITLLALSACKKKTSDPEPAPITTTTTTTGGTNPTIIDINSAPQVSYSFNGTQMYYLVDNINYAATSGTGGGGTPSINLKYYDSVLSRIPSGNKIIEITRNMVVPTFSTTVGYSAFNALFPLASIPYSVDTVNGVSIEIRDANDVPWGTNYGTRDQTGSTFNIVQTKDDNENFPFSNNNNGDYLYLKTYITFSCKVYNYYTGQMKTITNGKYVGHFGNI